MQFKWERFAKRMFLHELRVFVLRLLLFSMFTLLAAQRPDAPGVLGSWVPVLGYL